MAEQTTPLQLHIGTVNVYRFTEHHPDEFAVVKPDDLFIVFNNEYPQMCIWGEGAFWYRWGETDADWKVVQNVEYWIRIPTAKEIVDGEKSKQTGEV